jgi:Cu(I)/Ag(I) efflux system membrane protein CusA/SilA
VKPVFRPIWPDRRRMTWDELTAQMNQALHMPGWTNAWTMPIKTRIDMLSTGIRTPIGVKVFGAHLDTIERIGMDLEAVVSRVPGTRSVYSDRNTGGLYVDVVPDRDALARYGLTVADVQEVVEAAVGGEPIEFTVEGRARYTINVRYPRELRQDVDRLRHLLVPLHSAGGGSSNGMGAAPAASPGELLATAGVPDAGVEIYLQGMGGMGADRPRPGAPSSPTMPMPGRAGGTMPGMDAAPDRRLPSAGPGASTGIERWSQMGGPSVPLGEIARVEIVNGPPMIRDEDGLLAGYVYVDMDARARDIGGYVDEARALVAREVRLPPGYFLRWTGQYELLQSMRDRMKLLVPLTIVLALALLVLTFGNLAEALIVLCSVPFALVGSVWLMALLGYNLSTAAWVGIIALVGLATQTGVVMVVYCDAAYRKRLAEGRIRDFDDIVEATLEGSVQRVRPKLMTVATMMIGLVPLLWSQGAGADVMKRVAAPMVGGLFTSAFLTLEIIPVVYAWWRYAQLRREQGRTRIAA